MSQEDSGTEIQNPRILSAVYFSLLAIVATISIDAVVYFLGITQFVPLFQALILAVVVSATFGAIFGRQIIQTPAPYYKLSFFFGFVMVVAALPIYDLGFVMLFFKNNPTMFAQHYFNQLIHFYFFVLWISFLLVGLWLAIFGGFAAWFLRGFLAHHLMRSFHHMRRLSVDKKF